MICNLYDLPPDRDRIHTLVMKRRHSGLSPPEEEELALLEGREAEYNLPREEHALNQLYSSPGFYLSNEKERLL